MNRYIPFIATALLVALVTSCATTNINDLPSNNTTSTASKTSAMPSQSTTTNASNHNTHHQTSANSNETTNVIDHVTLQVPKDTTGWENVTHQFIESLSAADVRQLAQHNTAESFFISKLENVGTKRTHVLARVQLVAFSSNTCPPIIVATVYSGSKPSTIATQYFATYTSAGILTQPTKPLYGQYLASANPGLHLGLIKSMPVAITDFYPKDNQGTSEIELVGLDKSVWTKQWTMNLPETQVHFNNATSFLVGQSPAELWQLTPGNGKVVATPEPPVTKIPYINVTPSKVHPGDSVTFSGWVPHYAGTSLVMNWVDSTNNSPSKQFIVPVHSNGTFVYTTHVPKNGRYDEINAVLTREGDSMLLLKVYPIVIGGHS